jgi:putative ABC transport system permease protein
VAGAVRGYLAARALSLAAMRCLGASARVLFLPCLIQVLVLAALGIGAGLGIGAAAPFAVSPLLDRVSPVRIVPAVSFEALGVAAAFGLLTALFFSLPPLSAAGRVSPLSLFRGYAEPLPGRPSRPAWPRPDCARWASRPWPWPSPGTGVWAWASWPRRSWPPWSCA